MRSTVLGLNGPISFGTQPAVYLDKSGKIFDKHSTINHRFYSYGWEDLYYLLYCGEVRILDKFDKSYNSDISNINKQIEKNADFFIPNKNRRVIL